MTPMQQDQQNQPLAPPPVAAALVTGIAYDKKNPVKPPTWWTVGVVVLTIIGVIAGIGLSAVISD